ncbi:MAG TPA: hypothetical protein VFN94_09445 [Nitrospiria bacterium]|nr:hypothetical protein [Nitrospiria bacterium]
MNNPFLRLRAHLPGRSLFWTALAAYLLLFSSAALVHAYAQDELTDPHGCSIGAWVQHANATGASAPPLATLIGLSEFLPATHDTITESAVFVVASRGPPRSSL